MASEPSLWGWWITFGTLATLVDPCAQEEALEAAAVVFGKHRRRDVDLADLVVRPATVDDHLRFEAGRDRKWVAPEPEPEPDPNQGLLL